MVAPGEVRPTRIIRRSLFGFLPAMKLNVDYSGLSWSTFSIFGFRYALREQWLLIVLNSIDFSIINCLRLRLWLLTFKPSAALIRGTHEFEEDLRTYRETNCTASSTCCLERLSVFSFLTTTVSSLRCSPRTERLVRLLLRAG